MKSKTEKGIFHLRLNDYADFGSMPISPSCHCTITPNFPVAPYDRDRIQCLGCCTLRSLQQTARWDLLVGVESCECEGEVCPGVSCENVAWFLESSSNWRWSYAHPEGCTSSCCQTSCPWAGHTSPEPPTWTDRLWRWGSANVRKRYLQRCAMRTVDSTSWSAIAHRSRPSRGQ
jgi:hypothetical protein